MEDSLLPALAAGVLLIGIAVFAFAIAWRRVMHAEAPVPFFTMLERRGLTLTQAEEALGIDGLSAGVRRCVLCGEQHACRKSFAFGWLASRPVDCPNEKLLERAKGTSDEETPRTAR